MVAAVPRVKIMCYDEDVSSADDLIGLLIWTRACQRLRREADDWVSLEGPGVTDAVLYTYTDGNQTATLTRTFQTEPNSNLCNRYPMRGPSQV